MSQPLAGPRDQGAAHRALDLSQRLDQVRSRIEERFLEGSHVLGAALDSITTLQALLAQVLAALDEDAVAATVADLTITAQHLLDLPGHQAEQHARMAALAAVGTRLQSLIEDMRETLRYLRTVAVTVKIAGAEAGEFGEFANSMLARIHEGRTQIDGFAARIGLLLSQADIAAALHREQQASHTRSLPALTESLTRNAREMQEYHHAIRRLAATQDDLVTEIGGQVARTLSALQIGDMTRQRLEHVCDGLSAMAEGAAMLSPADETLITGLLGQQLADLVQEFHEGSGTVAQSLAGLAANMTRMMMLGRQVDAGDGGDAVLPAMERSIAAARIVVTRIEGAGQRAASVSDSAAAIAAELGAAVDAIAAIRADIQFMAINTSLRCRRLGDAGRAVVVVATELRNFAARLEDVSDHILSELGHLRDLTAALPPGDGDAAPGAALEAALETMRRSHRQMQDNVHTLTTHGEALADDLGHGVARLDFTQDLGDALDKAARELGPASDATIRLAADTASPAALALLARIRTSYTMARERRLHDNLVTGATAQPSTATTPDIAPRTMDDEDLAAILF